MLALDLPAEIETRLATFAQASGCSKAAFAREAILEHLENLEDHALAAPVLERLRNGQEPTFTATEVRQSLGLAD